MGVFFRVLMVRVEVPELPGLKVMEVALREVLGPVGVIDADIVTVPVNPLRLVSVMRDEVVDDRGRLREFGLDVMEKSETMTLTEMVWDRAPLVPVTIAE